MAGKPGMKPVPFVQVLAMREKRRAGAKIRELAAEYGITEGAVSRICTGDSHAREGGPRTQGARGRRQYRASTPAPASSP